MKPLYLLLSLLLIYSCNNPEEGRPAPVDSVQAKRERISQDSTGQRHSNIRISNDSALFSLKGMWKSWSEPTIITLGINAGKGTTYRYPDGSWEVQDTIACMEMMYKSFMKRDSMVYQPFVIITPDDTLHYYRGDTIHIGPNKDIQLL